MKVDILFIAAHPDDVELCCAGTIFKHIDQGATVGIVDMTQGELGTRGTAEIRLIEATKAAEIMGVSFRENLGLRDGFFDFSDENKFAICMNADVEDTTIRFICCADDYSSRTITEDYRYISTTS